MLHLFGKPARFAAVSGVTQEMKDIDEAGAGDDALVADVSEALAQVT